MSKQITKYPYRYIAKVVIEAVTPIAVGSGEKDIETDALVATDVNGLPYIPGTALAGILRHTAGYASTEDCIFGYMNDRKGHGSNIMFSEARMVGEDGMVVDGLRDALNSDFYFRYMNLPIRQHTRIGEKGVTVNRGKFDEQVVYKGTRFCFEIEFMSIDGKDTGEMDAVLQYICSGNIRIGGGTRSGFGEVKVISCRTKKINLYEDNDLKFYLEKSSSLSDEWEGDDFNEGTDGNEWIKYVLTLTPDDFFLFGSGMGDEEVDIAPVKESYLYWQNDKPTFIDDCVLIPGSSLKGAISHRTAYHYNRLKGTYADQMDRSEYDMFIGKNNKAVFELFGSEGEYSDGGHFGQKRGRVLFSDIIESKKAEDKILNHVSIDRFTGGAISGALFSEKITYVTDNDCLFTTIISVDNEAFTDEDVRKAFETALSDVCNGFLPLGGGVNRGNGTFHGSFQIIK